MAKKQSLRKQLQALENLAGVEPLSKGEAKRANGGRRRHRKLGTGAIAARGTGALWIGGTGAVAVRGSGALLAIPQPPIG